MAHPLKKHKFRPVVKEPRAYKPYRNGGQVFSDERQWQQPGRYEIPNAPAIPQAIRDLDNEQRLEDVQNLTVNRKLNRFLGGGSLAPDVMEILEKNAKTAGMDRTGGRLGQKPMNLEDELSLTDEKSGVDLTTNPETKAQNHGNTVMEGLIRLDDIQNTQDTTTVEKALKEQLKNPSFANQFKSLIMHTLKNTFGGVPQAAQNIVKSDVQMREGYEQNIPPSDAMIDFGKTVPAFARGVKESMFGEPDPVEFGGKAQTYDEILKGRKYQMGGPIGKKGASVSGKAMNRILSLLPMKFKN